MQLSTHDDLERLCCALMDMGLDQNELPRCQVCESWAVRLPDVESSCSRWQMRLAGDDFLVVIVLTYLINIS